MAGGIQGTATPWWQTSQGGPNGSALTNLQSSAPSGYKYDPVQMQYVRTPTYLGQDTAAQIKGLTGAFPQGIASAFGAPTGNASGSYGSTGAGGTGVYGTSGSPAPMVGTPQTPTQITPTGTPQQVQMGSTPGQVAAIQGPDQSAANSAAWAGAKDLVGQTARSSSSALAGLMAGRGISGSGVEGRGQVGIIQSGQQQLGDTARQQAINNAAIAEQNAVTSYQGDITQRGQNLGQLQAQANLGATQRGQDIGASEAATNSLVAQRGQDLAQQGLEYQGGVTQRGQDIQQQEAAGTLGLGYGQLGLSQQELALKQLQSLYGMSGSNTGYGGTAAY